MTTRLQSDGTYTRTPFENNRIPGSRINAIAAKVATFYPLANRPGDGLSLQNNYFKRLPDTNSYDSWLGKMDFRVSNRSNISFHYGQTPWQNFFRLWAQFTDHSGNVWKVVHDQTAETQRDRYELIEQRR